MKVSINVNILEQAPTQTQYALSVESPTAPQNRQPAEKKPSVPALPTIPSVEAPQYFMSDHAGLLPAIKGDVEKAVKAGCSPEALFAIAGLGKTLEIGENAVPQQKTSSIDQGNMAVIAETIVQVPQEEITDKFDKIIRDFGLPRGDMS